MIAKPLPLPSQVAISTFAYNRKPFYNKHNYKGPVLFNFTRYRTELWLSSGHPEIIRVPQTRRFYLTEDSYQLDTYKFGSSPYYLVSESSQESYSSSDSWSSEQSD